MDDFKIVNVSHRLVPTQWGQEPFTDLSVEIGGEVYGSRVHGFLGRFEIETVARNTVRAVKGRVPWI